MRESILSKDNHFHFSRPKKNYFTFRFKVQGIFFPRQKQFASDPIVFQHFQGYVNKIKRQEILKVSMDREILQFVKYNNQFIPFHKLLGQYKFLLRNQKFDIQFLYKNKRDQLQRKILNFQSKVFDKNAQLKEISHQQRSRIDLLKKLASIDSSFQSQNKIQVKIRIILYVSDPLVRDKTIPINNEELNLNEHTNLIKQAVSVQQSISIFVERAYAVADQKKINLHSILMNSQSHRDSINIIHFFTNIVRKDGELFIVFEGEKKFFGEQKLVKAMDFFQQVKNFPISLFIFIGSNVNLLSEVIPADSTFSVLLLSTYSANRQQSFRFFIRSFYEYLFNRNEINKSIEIAKAQYVKKYVNNDTWKKNCVCCCLHQHKQNCIWSKIVNLVGKKLAHKLCFHSELNSSQVKQGIWRLQQEIMKYFSIQAQLCGNKASFCCVQSHVIQKEQIMKTKNIFFPKNIANIFFNPQTSSEFRKTSFNNNLIEQKISPSRRYPLILFQIIKKILDNKNKIIQFVGKPKSGKTELIESALKYIQNRNKGYCFQNVDDNEGSLKECFIKMVNISQKTRKNKIFIHHNSGMIIEKQNILQFCKNLKDKLNFTFIIKINSQQQEKINSSLQNAYLINKPITITLPKLTHMDIFCQICHEIKHKSFFENHTNLKQIFSFCDKYHQKLYYRNLREFLKYYSKEDIINWSKKNKTLIDVFGSVETNFFKKMQQLKIKNRKLFDFLAFLSIFPQGVYLTKLTMILLKETFDIDEFQLMIQNKDNKKCYFQVLQKPVNFKTVSVKAFKVNFILVDDKVIRFFRNSIENKFNCQNIKHKYFTSFFNLIENLIFSEQEIMRKKNKKQKVFLEEGIFMFNCWKTIKMQHFTLRQQKQYKMMKNVWNEYKNQIDDKLVEESSDKKKDNINEDSQHTKQKFIRQKILSLILHQSKKFILNRHIPVIASLISSTQNKQIGIRQNQIKQNEVKLQQCEKKCPVIFYKKIIMICKIVLKQPQKYELIENKLRNLQLKFENFFKIKGSKLLSQIIQNHQHKRLETIKTHRSFHQLQQEKHQNKHNFTHEQMSLTFQNYFIKLLNYLQIKIILDRKQTFSLSFGDSLGKRKSLQQMNLNKQKDQKLQYLKRLENILPQMDKSIKSQNLIPHLIPNFSPLSNKNLFTQKSEELLKQSTVQELIVRILSLLLMHESEEQFINYFVDEGHILKTINDQIQILKLISKIQLVICQKLEHNEIYWFMQSISQEQISMQMIRLCMRKIQIHYKLKKSQKDKIKENLKRHIDLKNEQDLQQNCEILRNSYKDCKSIYYQNERVEYFLKHAEICQKYIDLVWDNGKVTEQFTTSIGQVDTEFSQIFSYICEQSMKKTLFNGQNNIVFFKSRAISHFDRPYTYVRKRNVTMKYMLKILSDFQINVTFLRLTKSNLKYIQKDKKQNPNCVIKYLVLTVDTIDQNKQLVLIFQQQKNITHQSVKLSQFLEIIKQITVQFIIIMGKNANILAYNLHSSLEGRSIVIIGIQSPKYGLSNFIQYHGSTFINELQQYDHKNQHSQTQLVRQIESYMNLQSFHCMLDMIICSLITDLVHLPYKKSLTQKNSIQSHFKNQFTYERIQELIKKSISVSKQIIRNSKWQKASQITIEHVIYPQDSYLQTNLKRNLTSISQIDPYDTQLTQRFSTREPNESVKYFPFFQKGTVIDNTIKLYESHLESQEYYENVNRNQHLFMIMSFFQQQRRKIVQIFGSQAAGKTSFLKQICWINFLYRSFIDGVYFIDLCNLSKSSQTLLWHIEIFYKQSKLFSVLEDDQVCYKTDTSTILLALDNLDPESIVQNQEFFDKLKGKPICIIYSTRYISLQKQLQKFMRINVVEKEKYSRTFFEDNDSIHKNLYFGSKQKHSEQKKFLHTYSYSTELQSKKSSQYQSQTTYESIQEQTWSYLKVDINILSKNALFNIAMSYLKKEELKTLRIGMYDFIKNYFAPFISNIIEELSCENVKYIPELLDHKKFSQDSSMVSYKKQKGLTESLRIQRTKSQFSSNQNLTNQGIHKVNQVKLIQKQNVSNVARLLKQMDGYFKSLSVEKVINLEQQLQINDNQQRQKVALIQELDEKILHQKKDSRLWFYEDCFQQLLNHIKLYDVLEVVFY